MGLVDAWRSVPREAVPNPWRFCGSRQGSSLRYTSRMSLRNRSGVFVLFFLALGFTACSASPKRQVVSRGEQKTAARAPSDVSARDPAMAPLRKVDPLRSIPRVSGFSDARCALGKDTTNCWSELVSGQIYHLPSRFRVHSECFRPGNHPGWDRFPAEGEEWMAATNDVVGKMLSAYQKVNPSRASSLRAFIANEKPIIRCKPDAPEGERTEAGNSTLLLVDPMEYALHGRSDDPGYLFRSMLWGELLNAKGDVPNLPELKARRPECQPHSPVYACVWLVHPSDRLEHRIARRACEACAGEERAEEVCSIDRPFVENVRIVEQTRSSCWEE